MCILEYINCISNYELYITLVGGASINPFKLSLYTCICTFEFKVKIFYWEAFKLTLSLTVANGVWNIFREISIAFLCTKTSNLVVFQPPLRLTVANIIWNIFRQGYNNFHVPWTQTARLIAKICPRKNSIMDI